MRLGTSLAIAMVFATALMGAVAQPARAATLDAAETDLVAQINSFRAARGLSTLVVSDTLTAAAEWMSADMATRNYFSHTSADGRSPTQRMADAGYPAYTTWTGEDLAAGYTAASAVLTGWINSPAHFAVLTNPNYRAIGVGRSYGASSTYGWYWAADFGGVIDGAARAEPVARVAPVIPFDTGFHGSWAGQSPNPTLARGQVTTLVLALKNTGSRGWYNGVVGQAASIGTNSPPDVERLDLAYGWLSANRLAGTTTEFVGPGQIGWFAFQIRAPQAPGTYRLDVRGVIDGTTWLADQGIHFLITVR